jgi:hypothetical protein
MGGWEGSSKVRGRRWRVQVSLDERVNKSGEGIHLSLLFTPPQPFHEASIALCGGPRCLS